MRKSSLQSTQKGHCSHSKKFVSACSHIIGVKHIAVSNTEQKIDLLETHLNTIDQEISQSPITKKKGSEQKSHSIEALYDDAVSAFHREQFDGKS
ncbi:MAG: hypothetical protein CMF43_06215 [Legionellales bacterium]|nr:hypothetical protein [Legionellales bacterium]